jgi:putative Ca2+/H+ antiporter (TMEM165/GDT1 family)
LTFTFNIELTGKIMLLRFARKELIIEVEVYLSEIILDSIFPNFCRRTGRQDSVHDPSFVVGLGEILGGILPRAPMNIGAGIIFMIFAGLSLKEAFEATNSEEAKAKEEIAKDIDHPRHLWLAIAFTFFVAELADKTMLATIAIASRDKNYFAIWLGSTLGLIVSNCLAIIVGKAISKKITGKSMHIITAVIFVVAGLLAVWQGLTQH